MPPLLEKHLQKDLLRFLTCGSVDDGKSTLIGRLLYDAGLVPDDQLATLRADQLKRSLLEPDLSLLLDGLQAEREQGITIDVAYRYFSTEQRSSLSPIPQVMSSTLPTWSRELPTVNSLSYSSMLARGYSPKHVVIWQWFAC